MALQMWTYCNKIAKIGNFGYKFDPEGYILILSDFFGALWTHCDFLSRVIALTRDIDIANLSVSLPSVCLPIRLSVHNVPVLDENGLTYRHSFFTVR